MVEHLNRKWGDSSIAVGEIMLFPFSVKQEDLASSKRWTSKDTVVSAADVYATVGSPTIFRLRYKTSIKKTQNQNLIKLC